MNTLSIQITPASPPLLAEEENDDDGQSSGAGKDQQSTLLSMSYDDDSFTCSTLPLKTRNASIGTIFGNRSPLLPHKKQYYKDVPKTPHTTPICSPKLSCDNDVYVKRRGSAASPRLGEKFKGFLNGRRGSCIESPMKSSLMITNYDDDMHSPYFLPISPSISSQKSNHKKMEFYILEELEDLDLEREDDDIFASAEKREYKNDTNSDESLARMVERMALEGYSDEQIDIQLQKEREKNQACKETYRPKAPMQIQTPWHSRIMDSINRSFRFENNADNLLQEEPKDTSKNILDSLPTESFKSEKFPQDDSNCTICLNTYTEGELMKSLPCFHHFHTDCLDQWFKVSCFCPVCKSASI